MLENEKGYLRDTCLTGQDAMKVNLDYFGVDYEWGYHKQEFSEKRICQQSFVSGNPEGF